MGKSCAGPPKARDPRPWPIWPMRKSVPGYRREVIRNKKLKSLISGS